MERKPEILAPAGSWESLASAIKAGADAVYFGLDKLNQRSLKKKFTLNDLKEIREFTAEKGIRAYLTLNSLVYEEDLPYVEEVLDAVKETGIDAVIAWDLAVVLKSLEKGIETHMSVMTGIANSVSANFFRSLGIKRIVPAKELNLKRLKELKEKTGLEVEIFVHGAMCMAISGRCFLSHDIFKTSANRGECYQICRHKFDVKIKDLNDTSGGREFILGEDYLLSATDLMTLDIVEYLTFADAWKIEGRNKNPDYVYIVTKAYKTARDALLEGTFNEELRKELIEMVSKVYHRDWDSGFYFGAPTFGINRSKATEQKVYIGVVEKYYPRIGVAEVKIETGELKVGDIIHIIGKKTGLVRQKVDSMQIDHRPVSCIKAPTRIGLKVVERVRQGDKVFVIKPIGEEEKLSLVRYKDI
ncbi:MAG TPA: U32 family peptidase [Aquifex aeolicus]|uniref:U32 family peptidase n=1 Tax=Aquifex aeolicus TaxID=63363 RepID=A0A9D0YPI5_AQUAO|nr:U32 family peptidase [Aquifex aeolicus]